MSPIYPRPSPAERTLNVSALVEQCQREIQAYHRGAASNEAYGLELLHRAILQGDQAAWQGVQQCLSEVVYGWMAALSPQQGSGVPVGERRKLRGAGLCTVLAGHNPATAGL